MLLPRYEKKAGELQAAGALRLTCAGSASVCMKRGPASWERNSTCKMRTRGQGEFDAHLSIKLQDSSTCVLLRCVQRAYTEMRLAIWF